MGGLDRSVSLSVGVPFALRPLSRGWGRPDHSEMPLAHMLPIMPPLRSRGWSWISYGIDLVGREIRAYCNGFEVWKIGTVRSSGAGCGSKGVRHSQCVAGTLDR